MLRHNCVDQQEENTCIEELRDEYTIGDGSQFLTFSVVPDGFYQFNDEGLKDQVYADDNERD